MTPSFLFFSVTPVGLTKSIPPFPRTYFEKQSALCFSKCASRDPGGIQTHDLQNRNLMLYSAKLQGRQSSIR